MRDTKPSLIFVNDENTPTSSTGSSSPESDDPFSDFTRVGLPRLQETDPHFAKIKNFFSTGMGPTGAVFTAVHRNSFPGGTTRRARLEAFKISGQAVAERRGGDANKDCGWYAATRRAICAVVSRGFSCDRRTPGEYGFGVHLCSNRHSSDFARLADDDENEMRHLLGCKVITGNREVVRFGSEQFGPSSSEFDSGVDRLVDPTRFIIWSSDMNSHILPMFVVSFKLPVDLRNTTIRIRMSPAVVRQPAPATVVRQVAGRSDKAILTDVMNVLAEILPAPRMVLLNKSVVDFRANKITKTQLRRRMSTLAGDELMNSVVKICIRRSNPDEQSDDNVDSSGGVGCRL